MAAQQEQPPAAGAATQERVAEVVFEALPDLQEQELIDLLDFIFTQHSGSAFNPDNTEKKDEIVQFLEGRPFASSERGVASLCKLSRHCLKKSEDQGNTAEHQLWLLSSGALNTAAAVASFEGDAARCFAALDQQTGGLERGKYLHRHYSVAAMRKYVDQAATAPAKRRWLVPENLPVAWTVATVGTVLVSWLLSLWFFPV